MASFNSYVCDIRFRNGLPLIITASEVHHEHTHYSEGYLIIPDDEIYLGKHCGTFDQNRIPVELLQITDDFLHEDALRISHEVLLTEYMYEKYPEYYKNAFPNYIAAPRPQNNNILVGLWGRGECRNKLLEIRDETNCGVLKEYIDMLESTFK